MCIKKPQGVTPGEIRTTLQNPWSKHIISRKYFPVTLFQSHVVNQTNCAGLPMLSGLGIP